jgi:aminoglycoside phosphotransferase (APT) family kinase protein
MGEPSSLARKTALDPAVIGAFLRGVNIAVHDDQIQWSLLAGGRSNLTYLVNTPGQALVLRRPPVGVFDPRAHDVGREFQMLKALYPLGVPVPEPVGYCEDTSKIGVPFYVMVKVDGRIVSTVPDAQDLIDGKQLHALADRIIDGLVNLHNTDPVKAGLEGTGKPQGFAARQVKRWTQAWAAETGRPIPALDEAARRLLAGLTAQLPLDANPPTIVHGDYNIGNLLISKSGPPKLMAILDWEMSALGHPMMDLGLLTIYNEFVNTIFSIDNGLSALPDFPKTDYFAQLYAEKSGRSTKMLDYFRALAFFKIIVITENIRARKLAGEREGKDYTNIGDDDPANADALLDLMSRSSIACLKG